MTFFGMIAMRPAPDCTGPCVNAITQVIGRRLATDATNQTPQHPGIPASRNLVVL